MLRRLSMLALLATLLGAAASPAQAATAPLPLMDYAVTPEVLYDPDPPIACDGSNLFDCGLVNVEMSFTGLNGRGARPPVGDFDHALFPGGSVRVTRSYGCQRRSDGRRLHRFDRQVTESATLNTRRGIPVFFPAEGDVLHFTMYAFLLDAQPGNCPKGTTAKMYGLEARRVDVSLDSRWSAVPDQDYAIAGRAKWNGAVDTPPPTPPSARVR